MQIQTLAKLLPELPNADCVVTFSDGDSYDIKDLDIQGEDEGDYEICVRFDTCLQASNTLREALAAGYLKTERVAWTSTQPHTPVGKTYLLPSVKTVFNRTDNYCVYERGT